MKARATGITLALTVAFAVGLSFAPIPDAYKPFPTLATQPFDEAVLALVLPKRGGSRAQEVMTGAPVLAQEGTGPADEEQAFDVDEEAEAEALVAEPVQPLSPADALGAVETRTVRSLERLAKKIGAKHVDLEVPCVEEGESGCARGALDRFFARLEALQRGEGEGPVRVVHLGDSQIASDHITDVIRRRLELRYGSGGRGFLFVDRPTKFAGRKVRTGEASPGWEVTLLTDKTRKGLLGFSGARFAAASTKEKTEFAVGRARTAELFFATSPRGGTLELFADGRPLQSLLTKHEGEELGVATVRLPEGTRTLSLSNEGEVSLFGISLENDTPGVVYDSVGLPGAHFQVYLRAPEQAFSAQLRQRDPSLVVLMLGGNDAYELSRGWSKLEDVRKNAGALIDRVRAAAPEADCLLFSPMDAGLRTVGGTVEPRPFTKEVAAVTREVAKEKGCAYWDLLDAMGGIGSVPQWLGAGLFHADLVHPRARGADLLGHLFDFSLERARAARPGAYHPAVEAPGLTGTEAAGVQRAFEKLAALKEDPNAESVRIVQLGASHTASHLFTDPVRAQLAKTFGDAGRGFVAAGRPSERLIPGGVERSIEGEWQFPDARERGPGEPWGLTGVRAIGAPGASMEIAFGVGQKAGREEARLSLSYLETADMGRIEVRIDGKVVTELGPAERVLPAAATKPTGIARTVAFPVTGTSHRIEVVNRGPGPITLFGASLDVDQGGVIYDALGLPGSTAVLADSYDKETFAAQLRERRADLYVLFYGTNESMLPELELADYAAHYQSLLATLRRASPSAGCLIIAPTDGLQRNADGQWVIVPLLNDVVRTLRKLAADEGCAFWSARASMGGPRAMRRWQLLDPPLGHDDGIHLTKEGYLALAHAFADDLLAAFRNR